MLYIWLIRLNDPLYQKCDELTKILNTIKSSLNDLKQKSKKRDLFTNSSNELNELQTSIYNNLEKYTKELEEMQKILKVSKVLLNIFIQLY